MHIVIGLIIAFALIALLSNRKTRGCRWRMDRARNQDGKTYYFCAACGAQDFTADDKPPKICLKP